MNKFAVNLSTIYTEVPFLERFKKAKEQGFSCVECQFPYAYSIEEIKRELEQNQLAMVLLNLPPGDWERGDRGIAADPDRVEEFRKSVEEGIRYAKTLKVSKIHCMAGIVSEKDKESAEKVYMENLMYAGAELAKYGISLLIEPINHYDMPGYFLNNTHQAAGIIKSVDFPNIKLQFDFYHIQRLHGNPLFFYEQYADIIDHVQIADDPGRHEPGTGKMDYPKILQYLKDTYKGYIGLEYNPKGKSEESFGWLTAAEKGGK